MAMKRLLMAFGLLAASGTATADSRDPEYEFFGFRISAGYQLGIGLKSSLDTVVPAAGATKAAAYARATGANGRYESDDGGFIVKDDGGGDPTKTTYWQVPSSAVSVNGAESTIALQNSFHDAALFRASDDDVAHGAHVELSTTIGRDGDWGLDVFIGFSWMKSDGCFEASGRTMENTGVYQTLANASTGDLMSQGYLDWDGNPTGESMGSGRLWQMGDGPQLNTDLGEPTLLPGTSGITSYHAEGDYEEYDIYGGLRLWYADDDLKWFKVTSTLGLGVDYGDFEYQMSAAGPNGVSINRSFSSSKWDVYGLLGLGIMVNFWDFDLSLDALWRFGQSPLRVSSPYVNGEIERPNVLFRATIGYNF